MKPCKYTAHYVKIQCIMPLTIDNITVAIIIKINYCNYNHCNNINDSYTAYETKCDGLEKADFIFILFLASCNCY